MTAWMRCARRVRWLQPRAHLIADAARQRAKGRIQQAVLVAEVMGDQAGRYVGAARDLRERRAHKAKFS
jgi:hypothetical protein